MQKWAHFYNIPTFQNRVEEIEDVNNSITIVFSFFVAIMECWKLDILWRKKIYRAHSSEDSSIVPLERNSRGRHQPGGTEGSVQPEETTLLVRKAERGWFALMS